MALVWEQNSRWNRCNTYTTLTCGAADKQSRNTRGGLKKQTCLWRCVCLQRFWRWHRAMRVRCVMLMSQTAPAAQKRPASHRLSSTLRYILFSRLLNCFTLHMFLRKHYRRLYRLKKCDFNCFYKKQNSLARKINNLMLNWCLWDETTFMVLWRFDKQIWNDRKRLVSALFVSREQYMLNSKVLETDPLMDALKTYWESVSLKKKTTRKYAILPLGAKKETDVKTVLYRALGLGSKIYIENKKGGGKKITGKRWSQFSYSIRLQFLHYRSNWSVLVLCLQCLIITHDAKSTVTWSFMPREDLFVLFAQTDYIQCCSRRDTWWGMMFESCSKRREYFSKN